MENQKAQQDHLRRYESQIASTPRHEMELHVRLGATKDGIVRGIDLYTLSNTGAYGEHGPTTVGLSGHKSIPLYGKAEAFRFVSDVVYTNHMSAGAYAATVRPRACLRWRPPSMSWPTSWASTRL